MADYLSNFSAVFTDNLWFAFVVTLFAGIVSSFSPCVLTSVPLIIAYVGGYAGDDKKRAFRYTLLFCLGLTITFTALGAVSALLGKLMTGAGKWWYLFLGTLLLMAAFQMLGIINFLPDSCNIPGKRKGLLGAFILGILGGIMSSPCATPALIAILALVSGQGNLILGISLLAVYSIGHCALLLLAGTSIGLVQKLASAPKTEKIGHVLKVLLGIVTLVLALYLFYLGF